MTEANSINASTSGIVGNTGTAFTGTPVTNHNVIVGGSTSSTLTNVSPSASSGIPLISQGASSDPKFDTALVVGGGTGSTSFTPYAVICGGTTGTGNLQNVSGVGTSGQVLTSNGAAALPTWQTVSLSAFSINIQEFSVNGTYTYTPTAGMAYCIIEALGAGGGGGGTASSASTYLSSGGGGGSGCYARAVFSSATIGPSQTVTVGAGGSGGAAGNNNGTAGGNSSVGSLISAQGGFPGGGSAGTAGAIGTAGNPGSIGGSSGGQTYVNGNYGTFGYTTTSLVFSYGSGADSFLGWGAKLPNATTPAFQGAGSGSGGGGTGGYSYNNNGTSAGGMGGSGKVIITEFIT